MKLLLDTHTFLWFVTDSDILSEKAKDVIEDAESEVYLSIASLWEMAIKASLGKLSLKQPFEKFLEDQLSQNQLTILNISPAHAALVASLPFHHRDPFDRMLIAQAISLKIPLVSRDEAFDAYSIVRFW
jgi:PIN domain nuclease of toxin-antitoxin system